MENKLLVNTLLLLVPPNNPAPVHTGGSKRKILFSKVTPDTLFINVTKSVQLPRPIKSLLAKEEFEWKFSILPSIIFFETEIKFACAPFIAPRITLSVIEKFFASVGGKPETDRQRLSK